MLIVALLACTSPPTSALPSGDPSRPDVILVVIDLLPPEGGAPRVDALAASGARFSSAWSPAPWALPAHATLLSGALPLHHGAIEEGRAVAEGAPWLPLALQEAGYATFGAAPTGIVSERHGFARGFDVWAEREAAADQLVAEALSDAATGAPGQPRFVFLHLPGDLAAADRALGAALDAWAGREAYVVVVSDHGEDGAEHALWPAQLRVPWVVAGPGIASLEIAPRVGLEDVAPTLAGLAGVALPGADGMDRSAALRGAPMLPVSPSGRFAETSRRDALRFRWHRAPYDLHADLRSGTLQLCDLRADPGCEEDVASERFDDVVELEAAMYAWLGTPFEAAQSGELSSSGVFVVRGQRAPGRLAVREGVRFALFPADAPFVFESPTGVDGGPWQVLGGDLPDEADPVRYVADRGR